MTFARMSLAFAVQMKGLGFLLCKPMYSLIADISSGTLRNTPLRRRSVVMSRKNRSTMLSQDAEVGVK